MPEGLSLRRRFSRRRDLDPDAEEEEDEELEPPLPLGLELLEGARRRRRPLLSRPLREERPLPRLLPLELLPRRLLLLLRLLSSLLLDDEEDDEDEEDEGDDELRLLLLDWLLLRPLLESSGGFFSSLAPRGALAATGSGLGLRPHILRAHSCCLCRCSAS